MELNHITPATQNKAFDTFKVLHTKEEIQFQIETGASCNVLSFQDYVRATGDLHGEELSQTRTVLVMHNKTQVSPKGSTWITLQRNGHTYRVNTLVVPGIATPLLSLKTSQQLGLVKIVDGDHLHTVVQQSMVPNTASMQPSSTETDGKMNNDPILEEYSDVFRGL